MIVCRSNISERQPCHFAVSQPRGSGQKACPTWLSEGGRITAGAHLRLVAASISAWWGEGRGDA